MDKRREKKGRSKKEEVRKKEEKQCTKLSVGLSCVNFNRKEHTRNLNLSINDPQQPACTIEPIMTVKRDNPI